VSELAGGAQAFRGVRACLIAGIPGQDGSLLARLLLEKGYYVTGTTRNVASADFWRLEELGIRNHPGLEIVELDVSDPARCTEVVANARPDEIYNVAGVSFIGRSLEDPLGASRVTGLGAWNLLEVIRTRCPHARYFQASSSEMFGASGDWPQDEETRFNPGTPYAVAKVFAHSATATYRGNFGIFAASGILYNHESPLRSEDFVTRKIACAAARVSKGMQDTVELGNLDAQRDWGYAPEYVEAMWRTLQAPTGGSYILATGRLTTVREFAEVAFRAAGIELRWHGKGVHETGVDEAGKVRIRVSPAHFRPAETRPLCGNPDKARRLLGWKAETGADDLSQVMVEAALKRLETGRAL
jgi:GDPmannose 4,6-dehydratase